MSAPRVLGTHHYVMRSLIGLPARKVSVRNVFDLHFIFLLRLS